MNTVVREVVSGTSAAGGMTLLALSGTALPVSLALGAGIYLGLRLLLPAPAEPASPPTREAFLRRCDQELDHLRKLHLRTPPGPITPHLDSILTVVTKLQALFRERPEHVDAAQLLPDKLRKLGELLERYLRLHRHRADSAQAPEALAQTEHLFAVAAGQWRELLDQLLDTDVIELKVQTRLYENLMDL